MFYKNIINLKDLIVYSADIIDFQKDYNDLCQEIKNYLIKQCRPARRRTMRNTR